MWTVKKFLTEESIALECSVPFSSVWSKNRMWRYSCHNGKARVYMSKQSKKLRNELAQLIKVQRMPWQEKKKLYVEIEVARSNARCDVQNFIDLICDAVRDGTGVGDNYFSGWWDWWAVEKGDEEITVSIFQMRAGET